MPVSRVRPPVEPTVQRGAVTVAGPFAPAETPTPASHWRLLVTDRLLGAFGPGTTARTMGELWQAAQGGTLDALVGAVPLRGADAVAAFAVAALGASTTFVVRGGGCADVGLAGRIRRVDARGNEPWYVAELGSVDRFVLGPLERSAGDVSPRSGDVPLTPGVVLGPWLGWTAATTAPQVQRSEPPTSTGDTNVLADLGRRAAALTRRRGEPPATSPTPETERAASFRVGARPAERVDAPVYIGRQPRSPRITGPVVPRLVRVESPSREVSATHVELRPSPHGLVLTDLESTNGTVIRQPGHGVRRLASGESLAVPPGTLIDIGDGNVIEILPYR